MINTETISGETTASVKRLSGGQAMISDVVPIFHFSELLSLAFKTGTNKDWFARHLIDPAPLLKSRGLNV
jgi:hypothetical protein